jgi:type IV pilus assembly protein PilC
VPVFEYKGKTLAGAPVAGELKARNRAELERILRSNRILVTSVSRKAADINIRIGTGIKRIHISRFTRQFATMIGAGLPMVQCLEVLAEQMESAEFRKIIARIKDDVQAGQTLSEAMSKHKKIFDDLFVNMIKAGEEGGALEIILQRLAVYREKNDALRRKVKGALIYPAVISVVATAVTIIMLTYIVPVFAKMFTGLGGELPAPTRMVLSISQFLQSSGLFILVFVIAVVGGYIAYRRTEKGRFNTDQMLLKLPIFGTLIRKSSVARFTRTLGTLLNSGVSILDALDITARTAGNAVVAQAINKAAMSIAEGETITDPLRDTGVFPPMVIQMVSVGEKTGGLPEMLLKIADFYDDEVDAAVAALTSLIEPVVIVVMGAVIGGILIAMYLPMFDIIGQIG